MSETQADRIAFVDGGGWFHCECGAKHGRGPINALGVYRCLNCGWTGRIRGLVELRPAPKPHRPDAAFSLGATP